MTPSSFILHPSSFRKAFSLPEVMFAIIILGIGFIMVAAMFPVAVQQAKNSHDDTTAAEVAKSAVGDIQQALSIAPGGTPPITVDAAGNCLIANDAPAYANWNIWNNTVWGCKGCALYMSDPRYAWTALYRRGGTAAVPDPFVQVFVFVLASADGRPYTLTGDVMPGMPNLWPRRVEVQQGTTAGTTVVVRTDTTTNGWGYNPANGWPDATASLVENAYLVTDYLGGISILRVSAATGNANEWQIYPGQSSASLPANGSANWSKAWLVGRRWNPATTQFEGNAQDLAVFTTYLRAN